METDAVIGAGKVVFDYGLDSGELGWSEGVQGVVILD